MRAMSPSFLTAPPTAFAPITVNPSLPGPYSHACPREPGTTHPSTMSDGSNSNQWRRNSSAMSDLFSGQYARRSGRAHRFSRWPVTRPVLIPRLTPLWAVVGYSCSSVCAPPMVTRRRASFFTAFITHAPVRVAVAFASVPRQEFQPIELAYPHNPSDSHNWQRVFVAKFRRRCSATPSTCRTLSATSAGRRVW
jgi:hypothetical protein